MLNRLWSLSHGTGRTLPGAVHVLGGTEHVKRLPFEIYISLNQNDYLYIINHNLYIF